MPYIPAFAMWDDVVGRSAVFREIVEAWPNLRIGLGHACLHRA